VVSLLDGEPIGGVECLELLGGLRVGAEVGMKTPRLSPVGTRDLGECGI
jgi:hypothetical protein